MCEKQTSVKRSAKRPALQKILIFGGTTEGRLLAEFCAAKEIPALVCVVSDYGRELVPESPWIEVRAGAMEAGMMSRVIREQGISLVVDATHPYAKAATANIRSACRKTGAEYLRCVRETAAAEWGRDDGSAEGRGGRGVGGRDDGSAEGRGGRSAEELDERKQCAVHWVRTLEEAADFLKPRPGNILVTTGSKELSAFTRRLGETERIFARVLPSVQAVETCGKAGVRGRHLICMQGPFSVEMNEALIRDVHAKFLLTKEAGKAGGFEEKLRAAEICKITCVVIGRPLEEKGAGREEICRRIEEYAIGNQADGEPVDERKAGTGQDVSCHVTLAGIGPGAPELMTTQVIQAIRESSLLLGAPRVLRSAEAVLGEKDVTMIPCYLAPEVLKYLEKAFCGNAVVLFSGDTGFYSGAAALAALLREKGISFRVLPGVSSLGYFAARLGMGWDRARLCSAHGRVFDVKDVWNQGADRIFLLLGGENGARQICERLCAEGMEDVRVTVGENLSYPDERIRSGTAETFKTENFEPLGLMLLERP